MLSAIPPCDNSTYFTCNSGQCIPLSSLCDMNFDCYDKSDEMDCQLDCQKWQFRCGILGQCIPGEQRCDYFVDCLDGTDEENCDNGESLFVVCTFDCLLFRIEKVCFSFKFTNSRFYEQNF